MPMPPLTIVERQNIDNGPWFSKLSPALQQDILARVAVRRLADGELAGTRGAPAQEWFVDIALFDGLPRTHDGHAHGPTTLLAVRKPDFKTLQREGVLRVEPSRLIVLSRDKLLALSDPASA